MTMSKKSGPTDDELLAQLDDLSKKPRPNKSSTNRNNASNKKETPTNNKADQDILAELDNLAQRPASRSATPAAGNTTTTSRNSEEKSSTAGGAARKSGESTRSYHQAFTPATTTTEESPEPETTPVVSGGGGGGGWWGGLLSTATAAVSQASAAVKEIQKNEEAQKWRDQLSGNIGMLRGYGGDLRNMALPTFQNILQTIAPPISAHERLQIHITHDIQQYPSLDPTIYQVFSRVMNQVEGGDLMVIQRGSEAGPKRASREGNRPVGGWQDGPWWRSDEPRNLNAVKGLKEGTKLVRASAESFATEYFANKGGLEAAAKQATETLSETNPTRDSEIFLAIQAIIQDVPSDLFQAGPSTEKEGQVKEAEDDKEEIMFAIYLHDPVHGIAFSVITQALPGQWFDWLNAPNIEGSLPESIQDIIDGGGVDPREWVSEWVEETLSLAIGTLAQRYVARRMGVGEGAGRGKGKLKADLNTQQMVESGGGEAARAMGGM